MRMQYDLLGDRFDDRNTTASTADLIKSMAGGGGAHHAVALKFGLRKDFSHVFPGSVHEASGGRKKKR